jgi:hypothetical protein
MDYYQKYIKYKNKYLYLKNQIGGQLFNDIFNYIIASIKEFNNNNRDMIAHIRGGSSIKYYLSKYDISDSEITKDIDILLITNKDTIILDKGRIFLQYIIQKLKDIGITTENINITGTGIKKELYISGIHILDILLFDKICNQVEYEDNQDDSIFEEVLLDKGINLCSYSNILYSSNDIEFRTFTDIQIEKLTIPKMIKNIQNHIDNIPEWKTELERLKTNQKQSPIVKLMIQNYEKQLKPEYIQKLYNKLERYNKKLIHIANIDSYLTHLRLVDKASKS